MTYPQPTEEVHPASSRGRWTGAPDNNCDHVNVVQPQDVQGEPGGQKGHTLLYCERCEETWWEPLTNIAGSPWAS